MPGGAFGGSVWVFMSAGLLRLTRFVAKQGMVTYSFVPPIDSTPNSGILCPAVPLVPQRQVPAAVPTAAKFVTVLAAAKSRKKTLTGPTVVAMLDLILTRATAKLNSWGAEPVLGKN